MENGDMDAVENAEDKDQDAPTEDDQDLGDDDLLTPPPSNIDFEKSKFSIHCIQGVFCCDGNRLIQR